MENIMSSKLFRTRQGTILLGVVAAVLAAIALIVYLNHYRNSVNNGAAPLSVLVAKNLIPQNTSGNVIASSGLYTTKNVPKSEAQAGALTDPSAARRPGRGDGHRQGPAAHLVRLQCTLDGSGGLPWISSPPSAPSSSRSTRRARWAVRSPRATPSTSTRSSPRRAVPRSSRRFCQNMYVLNSTSDGNVTLRATPHQAGQLIYASGNDKIWLTLRPPRGTREEVVADHLELAGRLSMDDTIRILVTLAEHADPRLVESALRGRARRSRSSATPTTSTTGASSSRSRPTSSSSPAPPPTTARRRWSTGP